MDNTRITKPPIILEPATPSELLSLILAHHSYPTTLIVAWPKAQFIQALTLDVHSQPASEDGGKHDLLKATLMQTAISRHIRILFAPTLVHLRAALLTFTASASRVPVPPRSRAETKAPLLLVYGLLDVHRLTDEWSAQGISATAASLVDTAARNNFTAAIIEPRGVGSCDDLEELMGQQMPLLTGAKDATSWSGRTLEVKRVLGRWFTLQASETQYQRNSTQRVESEQSCDEI